MIRFDNACLGLRAFNPITKKRARFSRLVHAAMEPLESRTLFAVGLVAVGEAEDVSPVEGTQRVFYRVPSSDEGHQDVYLYDASTATKTKLGSFLFSQKNDPTDVIVHGGSFYYVVGDAAEKVDLWTSDGTVAGTKKVTTIDYDPATNDPTRPTGVTGMVEFGDTIYFVVLDEVTGGGKLFAVNAPSQTGSGAPVGPAFVTGDAVYTHDTLLDTHWVNLAFNNELGYLYYAGGQISPRTGVELRATASFARGSALVKDINIGDADSSSFPENLVTLNGKVIFDAYEPTHGRELWITDTDANEGTLAGAHLVKDINPGVTSGISEPAGPFVNRAVAGNFVYFFANDGSTAGSQLWRSDGTSNGTTLVKSFTGPENNNGLRPLTVTGSASTGYQIYFTRNEGNTGDELWVTDGTAQGTRLVKDINPGPGSAFGAPGLFESGFTAVGQTLYFVADDGVHGPRLWRTNGLASGTEPVADAANLTSPRRLVASPSQTATGQNVLYFTATGPSGAALYRLTDTPNPFVDSNDTIAEAETITTKRDGEIEAPTDVDMFKITVTAGQRVFIDVDTSTGPASGEALDSYVRVFNAAGNRLVSNDNGAAPGETKSISSFIDYTFATAGTYYIGVSGQGNQSYDPLIGNQDHAGDTGKYSLQITRVSAVDTDDTIATAVAISTNSTRTLSLLRPTDVDMFKFTVTAGQKITIDIDTAPGSESFDSYLRLFDAAGNRLISNDNGTAPGETASKNSFITYTFSTAGTYYLGVSGAPNTHYDPVTGEGDVAGSVGTYVLQLSTASATAALFSENAVALLD